MSYLVKNTAWDPRKIHLHRVASCFITEPSIGGVRLRKDATIEITNEQYENSRHMYDSWEKKGMVEITAVGGENLMVTRETTEPRVGASETPRDLSEDGVDEVVENATVSDRPFIAEQLAAEQRAAEKLSTDLRSTQQQLATDQREDGAKKGPGKKKF